METVLKAIFGSLFNAIMDWWKGEKAAAAEWEGRARKVQMESMAEGIAIEKQASKKAKEVVASATPADWNKRHCGSVAVLFLCCFFLQGCFRFYVAAREYRPVYEVPPAPEMEDTTTPWTKREQKLVKWAEQLEEVIKTHNDWAAASNKQHGYTK